MGWCAFKSPAIKQGEEIFKRTENLQILTDTLQLKKELKQALLLEQQKEKNAVEKEKNEQENLLSQVKKKENKYKKRKNEKTKWKN